MKTETFIDLLENNARIQHIETAELKVIVEEFPYFQAARALYLNELKSQDSFKYNKELKIKAAYTTDRTILFNYITSFNADTKNILKENTQLSITTNEVKAPLEIGKPFAFSSTENHSFNQWLQLSPKKVIIRNEEKQVQQKAKKEDLIDKFIQNSPKIAPLEKGIKFTVPVSKNKYDAALMTETLAKVYLEQKKYENAMQAYKILSLKYPEKSGFFADQIKRIQILQKNK